MGDDHAFVFELLFHQVPHLVDGNLSLITKHTRRLFKDQLILWLRGNKDNPTVLRKFVFSPALADYWPFSDQLVEILGDPRQYIDSTLTWDQIDHWWPYHVKYHADFEGQVLDLQWSLANYTLKEPTGALAHAMITKNLPMPIDLYARVHHRYHEMEWDCHQRLGEYVMLILEHFDTSCCDSIYTGDVEGIKILLKLDLDDLMELSLSSGAVIPITNPEPFTEDERRRIETINKHNTEPVNYTPVVVLGTGISDAIE
jgi:hypothetical protein